MPVSIVGTYSAGLAQGPSPAALLPAEVGFYESYAWCLNPHLRVDDAMRRLRLEIARLATPLDDWQKTEVAINIFLLACALLNSVDEYLRGPTLKMPARFASTWSGRFARRVTECLAGLGRTRLTYVRRWRARWLAGLDKYLPCLLQGQEVHS